MRKGIIAVLAVAVVISLISGILGVATHARDRGPAPAGTPLSRPRLDEVVRLLQRFVERERGLTYKHPVKVTLLDDDAFKARITEGDEEDDEEIREAEAVLRAMGLLKDDVDLVKALDDFAAAAVAGFFDPETKELVVRGGKISPFVRVALVHELTHALEDQQFNLHRENLEDEAYLGFASLVEGSALRIERIYVRSLSTLEQLQAAAEEARMGRAIPDDLPQVLEAALGFPYSEGPDLVQAVVRGGGQARLDAAFSAPPASTEQVLDPRRFLSGDAPRPAPLPAADRPAFDDGEIGQLFLMLMLRAQLSRDKADDAAEGWGGDRYVAWKDDGRTCVRMNFVMDSARDTEELASALSEWARRRPAGSVTASGTSMTTCG